MHNEKFHGVNLGGWLILEKWMTPDLFENLEANDEYCFILELGIDDAKRRLEQHWQTFITKDDFIWIKNQGLNTIRIPVGYWNFEEDEPFISSLNYFEQALIWAEEVDLKVVIDLHGAPGSQNGNDHAGRIGEIGWHKAKENIERTLKIIEHIAEKYGNRKCVVGIELLNEPHWDVQLSTLKSFYKKAYELVRKHCDEKVAVIMHDGFRPEGFLSFFKKNNFANVIMDCHLYQCYSEEDINMNIEGHLQKTAIEWKNLINEFQKYVPVLIGEWSLGLNPISLKDLNEQEQILAKKTYADAQVLTFEQAKGWFFWNYKVNNEYMKIDWSFRELREQKIL